MKVIFQIIIISCMYKSTEQYSLLNVARFMNIQTHCTGAILQLEGQREVSLSLDGQTI